MRWRFVDTIDGYVPWQEIRGKKAASFEECKLLNRLGRDGELPESLALEACVDQVRRLVEKSSGYRQTALLEEVEAFDFSRPAATGDVLYITARVIHRQPDTVKASCDIRVGGEMIAHGNLGFLLAPLADFLDAQVREAMWEEVYGAA